MIQWISFGVTTVGIALGATIGILGILGHTKAEQNREGARRLMALIVIGGVVAIGADLFSRYQSEEDRRALLTSARASAAQFSRLQSENDALIHDNNATRKSAEETNRQARSISRRSLEILATVQQTLSTTASLERQTKGVAAQARTLVSASSQSLKGIERLSTPIREVYLSYIVEIPASSQALEPLKKLIESGVTSHRREFAATHSFQESGVPFILLSRDLLGSLPTTDAGYVLLQALDLRLEVYKPPFPREPAFGNPQFGWSFANFGSLDYMLQTQVAERFFSPTGITSPYPSANYVVELLPGADGPSQDVLRFSAMGVPATLGSRSGRVNSVADLAGAEMLFHLISNPFGGTQSNPFVAQASLRAIELNIDGISYPMDLTHARVGKNMMFRWYEFQNVSAKGSPRPLGS